MKSIDWLPPKLVARLGEAVDKLQGALADHLQAVALVGAAANPERHDRAQAPELLAVAAELSIDDLRRVAEALQSSMRQGVRVRIITADELRCSADVFSVEIAEYQAHHVALLGEDPFETIQIAPGDLRRSVEQGLRGLGRRARNRVLAGIGSGGRREDPQRALAQSVERFLVLARQTLIVLNGEAPAAEADIIDALEQVVEVKLGWLRDDLAAIRAGKRLADPLGRTCQLLAALSPLVDAVDAMEAA